MPRMKNVNIFVDVDLRDHADWQAMADRIVREYVAPLPKDQRPS